MGNVKSSAFYSPFVKSIMNVPLHLLDADGKQVAMYCIIDTGVITANSVTMHWKTATPPADLPADDPLRMAIEHYAKCAGKDLTWTAHSDTTCTQYCGDVAIVRFMNRPAHAGVRGFASASIGGVFFNVDCVPAVPTYSVKLGPTA